MHKSNSKTATSVPAIKTREAHRSYSELAVVTYGDVEIAG